MAVYNDSPVIVLNENEDPTSDAHVTQKPNSIC